ncbi:hypothetical protein Tco_1505268 [Tanacetum coccineum]
MVYASGDEGLVDVDVQGSSSAEPNGENLMTKVAKSDMGDQTVLELEVCSVELRDQDSRTREASIPIYIG